MGKTLTAKYRYRKADLANSVQHLADAYNVVMYNCEDLDLPVEFRKANLRSLRHRAEIVADVIDAILQEQKNDDD